MQFTKAVRKASPMLISVAGVSGSGKTYTSLLLAAGIAGPNGRVGFIDTENGRGSMYADSPGILKALPNGYEIAEMQPDFSPEKYVEAITAAEKAGINVLIIDSTTHEWEGIGGCADIAEKYKLKGMPNWAKAKMSHKRFVNHCLTTNMHLIFCLRARDKVKMVKNPARGEDAVVPIGIQPIAEKNFVFEMTVSLLVDESTHFANPIKVPEPLVHLFPGGKMLTKQDGEHIRQWNDTGSALNQHEQLTKRARAAAESGVEEYRAFWSDLTQQQRVALKAGHETNKKIAEEASRIPTFGSADDEVPWPDSFDGPELVWNGKHLLWSEETGNYIEKQADHAHVV